ncbi:MAG: DNA polymerase Y family protein [Pseudomonadota bacterium]
MPRPPRAVYAKLKNALRLTAVDESAEKRGLHAGLTLADARARVPDLDASEQDALADAALLEALADWCDRYTPLVALDPPDGLLLDISGCAHLFGGEAVLRDDLVGRLEKQGFAARAAIAGTLAAAAALARHGRNTLVPAGGEREAIAPLPIAALRLEPECVDGLAQVGLRNIADLIGRPRAPLAGRFGLVVVTRLDEALGQAGESLSPRLMPPALVAERRFAEAVLHRDAVLQVVGSLGQTIAETLALRGEGARLVEAALFRVDGVVTRIRVGTGRPLRDPALMVRLFDERLKGTETEIDAGFGFDLIRLAVLESACDAPRQIDMRGRVRADESVDVLIDRLGARLGMENVTRFLPGNSHLPEEEAIAVPAALACEEALAWPGTAGLPAHAPPARPIRFLSPAEPIETLAEVPEGPPIRFRWRKVSYDVRLAEGPERIAPPWWQGDTRPPRDYFRVEDAAGRRFWLFREGLYGGAGAADPAPDDAANAEGAAEADEAPLPMPRWYMQGLFP